ncbi:hypothetical protein HKD37_05G012458 [Glycine soja]
MEELDNKNDFDIEYNPLVPAVATIIVGNENIAVIERKSFVFTQGWDFDPNNDVYHFREVPNPNNTTLRIHAYLFIFFLFNFSSLSIDGLFTHVLIQDLHRKKM